MGISNDYGLVATPYTSDPDPASKSTAFDLYKAAGVDSMQVNIRGGTHYESSFIPGQTVPALGLATLRGNDAVAWYTAAWFDKYVRCQGDAACAADADRELLTNRWQTDQRNGEVDAAGDPNLYSFYFPSRYDIGTGSGRAVCDDMRKGCASMEPDGGPANFALLNSAFATTAASGGGRRRFGWRRRRRRYRRSERQALRAAPGRRPGPRHPDRDRRGRCPARRRGRRPAARWRG